MASFDVFESLSGTGEVRVLLFAKIVGWYISFCQSLTDLSIQLCDGFRREHFLEKKSENHVLGPVSLY